MEKPFGHWPGKDNRTFKYDDPNDRLTFMTDMQRCMNKLEAKGFTDQFKVENNKLVNINTNKKYTQREVKAVNFYRFEGITNPEDMAILYAIVTADGSKGTLADGYGVYADDATGAFMIKVEIHKEVRGEWE